MTRYRLRWLLVSMLMLFTCWCAIAGHSISPSTAPVAPANCHVVEHAAGVTCVPNTIQRLVTLDAVSFEYAIALGLQPVGAPLSEKLPSYLGNWLAGVENIGKAGEPNLERVLALKPDLILGLNYHQGIYAQAAQIAPTLLIQFDYSGEWKTVLQRFSAALDRESNKKQIMDQYQHRLHGLRTALKTLAKPLAGLTLPLKISVVRIYPDTINLYLRDSFCGTVLQDAALDRPAPQNISAAQAKQQFGNEIQSFLSLEQVDQADGDVMFIWTSENTTAANQTAQKKLVKLQSHPLWQQLHAIQRDRVYFVPEYWIGSGPIAANAIIDDLFKYLVQPS